MVSETAAYITTADLASREDFPLGATIVSPSRRSVTGPGGTALVEPRVMQVLTVLAEAAGNVVTRDLLFRRCWGNADVGDDSLNRAIAGARRIAASVAENSFTIENIPRTGYRLTEHGSRDGATSVAASEALGRPLTRRWLMSGAALLSLSAIGGWWTLRSRDDASTTELIERGKRILSSELPDGGNQAARLLQAATQRDADNAQAWGLLAVAYREAAEGADPAKTSEAIEASEAAARKALAIDPKEGNALTALAMLRPYFGEWGAAEDRLMNVLAVAPDNLFAMNSLVPLLQGVGRVRTSYEWNERVLRIDPNSPVAAYRRAIKLWQLGRPDDADQAIDRTMQLWPRLPAVWNARMMIFAFTGRASAGLAFLDETASRPESLTETAVNLWRITLKALASRARDDVAAARAANIAMAPRSPGFANNAMMSLSMLGEIDAAFDVAFGTFLRRGRLIGTLWGGAGEMPVNTLRWRRTVALFIPATAPLRADARFTELCDGIGLSRYWRERRIIPDYLSQTYNRASSPSPNSRGSPAVPKVGLNKWVR